MRENNEITYSSKLIVSVSPWRKKITDFKFIFTAHVFYTFMPRKESKMYDKQLARCAEIMYLELRLITLSSIVPILAEIKDINISANDLIKILNDKREKTKTNLNHIMKGK